MIGILIKNFKKIRQNNLLSGNFSFPVKDYQIYDMFDETNKCLFTRYYGRKFF